MTGLVPGSQFGGGVVDTYEGDYASALAEALEMLDEIDRAE